MQRIGKRGEGYERLAAQFKVQLERGTSLCISLIEPAPEDIKRRFIAKYFQLTPDALTHFLELLRDLRWYKIWLVDRKPRGASLNS